MGSEDKNVKVPLLSKIAYGFGDVGCNFSWMFVSNFLMIFYTDVFGISMAAVSALMLFSRFWDAINDPIIGGLTDKTKSRWGRYRPWLLFAAPATAVLLMLAFWAHPDWPNTAKIVYMVITYCLLVLGYTCVNIPYGTLCGAMTQNIDERAKINTSRSVAAMVAIGVINIITVPLISHFGASSAKTGYLTVAILYGCIFMACHFFCFAKTKEVVTIPEKEKISMKVQLQAVLQNRPYLLALVGQVLFGFTLYARNADVLYYFTYVEGSASYYTIYSMCIIVPSIIGADTRLRSDELDVSLLENCKVFHYGSLSLTDEPARSATIQAVQIARNAGALISYDPNYRASLWSEEAEAVQTMKSVISYADVMKVSDVESLLLTGKKSYGEAMQELLTMGPRLVAITLGENGVLIGNGQAAVQVSGYKVKAVDTTGAGDSFWGGFLSHFLRGGREFLDMTLADWEICATYGNATAACCVQKRGGIPAIPSKMEVEALVAGR